MVELEEGVFRLTTHCNGMDLDEREPIYEPMELDWVGIIEALVELFFPPPAPLTRSVADFPPPAPLTRSVADIPAFGRQCTEVGPPLRSASGIV